MNAMRKLLEQIEQFSEAPASDDSFVLNTLVSMDMELETLSNRLVQLVKRSHNHPVDTDSYIAQERNAAKEPVLHHLRNISDLLEKL